MTSLVGSILNTVTGNSIPPAYVIRRVVIATPLVLLFLVTAYGALMAAGWYALEPIYGPAAASLLIAAAAIVLAFVTGLIVVLSNAVSRHRERQQKEALKRQASQAHMAELALTALPLLLRKSPLVTLALVSGLAYTLTKDANK